MKNLILSAAVVLVLAVVSHGAQAGMEKIIKQAQLQSAMQQYIDHHLVDGVFLHFDPEKGQVRRLHPGASHPMILTLGEYFVLCSDFRDDDGSSVNVDFYLAKQGRTYTVFESIVENRQGLTKLVNSGEAARFK